MPKPWHGPREAMEFRCRRQNLRSRPAGNPRVCYGKLRGRRMQDPAGLLKPSNRIAEPRPDSPRDLPIRSFAVLRGTTGFPRQTLDGTTGVRTIKATPCTHEHVGLPSRSPVNERSG